MLKDRIKSLCKNKGVTMKQVERDLNLGGGYLSKLDASVPNGKNLQRLADYFGVSSEFLMTGETKTRPRGTRIPVLGRVAAGIPIDAIEDILEWEEIANDLAIRGDYFSLRIKGDSMSPKIPDGCNVIVRQQDTAENGDIVIAQINGHDATCKQFKQYENGIALISVNPAYQPFFFSDSEKDSIPVKIIGKVVEARIKL